MSRVVVTGMGAVTPLGRGVESFWSGLLAGKSGIRPTDALGGEPGYAAVVESSRNGPVTHAWLIKIFVQAYLEALQQAGWMSHEVEIIPDAFCYSCGWGWPTPEDLQSPAWVDVLKELSDDLAGFTPQILRQVSKLQGHLRPSYAACAASTMALGDAFWLVKEGKAEHVICGGVDSRANPLAALGYGKLGALATGWESDPAQASRPFDKRRNGFVIGEGAGVLILESLESAQKRGAKILAEILSAASTTDAFRITDPEPFGEQAARCMNLCLERAGLTSGDVGAICCHATSTPANDAAEYAAMKRVFGERLSSLPLLIPKSNIGHLAMACGAVETIAAVRVLEEGIIPPALHTDELEFELALKREPTKLMASMILKNSFGFGGQNASLLLRGHTAETPAA